MNEQSFEESTDCAIAPIAAEQTEPTAEQLEAAQTAEQTEQTEEAAEAKAVAKTRLKTVLLLILCCIPAAICAIMIVFMCLAVIAFIVTSVERQTAQAVNNHFDSTPSPYLIIEQQATPLLYGKEPTILHTFDEDGQEVAEVIVSLSTGDEAIFIFPNGMEFSYTASVEGVRPYKLPFPIMMLYPDTPVDEEKYLSVVRLTVKTPKEASWDYTLDPIPLAFKPIEFTIYGYDFTGENKPVLTADKDNRIYFQGYVNERGVKVFINDNEVTVYDGCMFYVYYRLTEETEELTLRFEKNNAVTVTRMFTGIAYTP